VGGKQDLFPHLVEPLASAAAALLLLLRRCW